MFFFSSSAEAALQAGQLETVLQPQALIAVRYVRELRADGIGINELQVRENILQLGAFGDGLVAAAGEEFGVEIGIGETEIFKVQHIGLGAFLQAERIQIGDQVAAIRVDLNEARHRALLGARSILVHPAGLGSPAAPAGRRLQTRQQALADGGMGHIAAGPAAQVSEVGGPGRIDPGGILQELFVEILDVPGIAAGKRRGG